MTLIQSSFAVLPCDRTAQTDRERGAHSWAFYTHGAFNMWMSHPSSGLLICPISKDVSCWGIYMLVLALSDQYIQNNQPQYRDGNGSNTNYGQKSINCEILLQIKISIFILIDLKMYFYSCSAKLHFQKSLWYSVTWSFRNHCNMLICCLRNISYYCWKQSSCLIFLWKR